MNKVLRIFGILIGSLIALVVIAALVLPRIIDPNNYRDKIAEIVKKETGRDLVITGEIGWSVFPWLGVEVGETRLSNAPGFGDAPFAQVSQVQVRVRLLPLLRKELEMSTLVLEGLQLNLAKDKSGRTNWDDLMRAQETKKSAPEKPAADDGAASLAALTIGGVKVSKAQLVWDDRSTGNTQRIEDLYLDLGAIRQGYPVDLMLGFTAKSGKPELVSQVKLMGRVAVSKSYKQIDIPNFEISLDASGDTLPGGKLHANLQSNIALDLNKQTLSLSDLMLTAQDLVMMGQMQGTGIGGAAPQFTGDLRTKEFVPRSLLLALGQTVPETSDAGVLVKAKIDLAFKATSNSATLSELKLLLDDSNITGTAGVTNFSAPAINFNLALDSIDLDRYLPPQKPGAVQAAPTPGEAAAGGAGALPVETLRALNMKGTMKIGRLKAYQLRSNDITVTVSAKDGLVQVHPASARMYEGNYNGNVTLDARGQTPRISMDEKLTGIQVGPMLTDMHGEAKVTGRADIAVKLTAAGNDPVAMRKSMNGNASFNFADGTIKGMNVLNEIRKAYALFKGKPAPDSAPNQTDFNSLSGTATITNGLVSNNDLLVKSAVMQVQGAGTADLVSEKLDYGVTATLVDTLEGKGELTGRPIPVRISGTFAEPKVGVDMNAALKQEIKKQIEKQIEKKLGVGVEEKKEEVQQDLEKKLEDKVQDKLKGLFNR